MSNASIPKRLIIIIDVERMAAFEQRPERMLLFADKNCLIWNSVSMFYKDRNDGSYSKPALLFYVMK